jgi:hypothetical protein
LFPGSSISTHNHGVTTKEPAPGTGEKNPHVDRFTRIARWVLLIYLVALVISAPFVLGLFAYGLAHAGDGAIVGLLALLGGAFVLFAAPPFMLLVNSTHPAVVTLKIICGGVMLVGIGGMLKLLNFYLLEPQWMKFRQQRAMAAVQPLELQESSLELAGRRIGIKIVRDVKVKRDVKLDRYGLNVLQAIREVEITVVDAPPNSSWPFGRQVHSALLSINGQPVSRTLDSFASDQPDAVIPKGKYRVEHTLLLWGLQANKWPQPPCRDERYLESSASQHDLISGYALKAGSTVSLEIGSRRGYPMYPLPSLPLQFRYEHSSWMRGIRELPIESCEEQTVREREEAEAARLAQIDANYYSGDSSLAYDDNPLRAEMCADNLEAVAARITRGVPKQNISGMISECTIDTPRPEIFAIVMPALYARSEEREGYCSLLSIIHNRRAVAHMEKLVAAKLPILCTAEEQPNHDYEGRGCEKTSRPDHCRAIRTRNVNMWRSGLYPVNAQGQQEINQDPVARNDTVRWLTLLHSQGVPICRTLPDNTNLLQDVVTRFPAEVVHYLATIGCDAHVSPPPVNEWPWSTDGASAAVHWYRRRNGLQIALDQYAPVQAEQARIVANAMGDLTAAEINQPNSNGQTLLHLIASQLFHKPEEFRYLLARGARLDMADKEGHSWFSPGYAMRYDSNFSIESYRQGIFALLDQLSVAQLNEVWSPTNTLTGEPGLPIEEYGFEPGQLNSYLCRRGAKACRH